MPKLEEVDLAELEKHLDELGVIDPKDPLPYAAGPRRMCGSKMPFRKYNGDF